MLWIFRVGETQASPACGGPRPPGAARQPERITNNPAREAHQSGASWCIRLALAHVTASEERK
jgi:hypothetical protein